MPFIVDSSAEDSTLEPIAIVGMGCRLPGSVDSASKLWDLLCKKESVQTPKVPKNRFNIDAHYHPDLARPGSFTSLGGYFLDGNLEDFDPTFFNMTPIEAMWLDPQQRKMLEVSYECLESAGLTLDSVSGSNTAVYVGCFTSDYQQMSTSEPDFRHNYCATGVDVGVMSNRIGNTFNLNGPSFTINTACSSSVYAIHNACHALRARDCEAAIAGGVNLILTVDQHINTAKLGVLSETSTCHTFDAAADGYGRGEGAGALYLKRLSDAIRDGDVIRGVIRSSAVNTNGKVEGMGITFPSVTGQERVVRSAYKRANLDPNKTAYLECHGTGTPVGDPIEVRAVSNAMNDTRSPDKPLLLGAVKASIGHSEAASGIFAVMKAAMVTESGLIPGVCGFKTLNPNIKDREWGVKINTDLIPWPQGFDVRRASVSSFGYGGTNGHVIIESIESVCPWYEHGKPKSIAKYYYNTNRPFLIGMSAHDKKTLTRNIQAHQKVADNFHLPDLAYTLNSRRTRFTQRGYTVVSEGEETAAFDANSFAFGAASGKPVELGFIFTGQGAQWPRMGYEAMQMFPIFGETIDALDRVLQSGAVDPKPSWTLRGVLESPKEASRVGEAEISQPACTAVQIAITDTFASWGITPSVTIGHSSGEIGAAYAAGRLSAPEAILAAFFRGYAVKQSAPVGTMLAVGVGALEAERYIPESAADDVTIACENSPSSVTLSGTSAGIAATKARLDEAQIFSRELRTGKAYHSSQMNAVAPLYEGLFSSAARSLSDADFAWRRPATNMISSVTGAEYTYEDISIAYWCDNLRSRVLFDSAMTTLGSSESFSHVNMLIEIGPHSALGGPIKQICSINGFHHLGYAPSLLRGSNCAVALLKTAGELFNRGFAELDFESINSVGGFASLNTTKQRNTPRYIPDLPPYQWNYEHTFWYEPRSIQERRQAKHERHDILGRRVFGLSENSATWKNTLRQRDVPWLKDHTLGDAVVFPAAGHMSLAIEAYIQLLDIDQHDLAGVEFRDIDIGKALIVPDTDDGIEVHTRLQKISQAEEGKAWFGFVVESIDNGTWSTHSEGKITGILTGDDVRSSEQQFNWPVDINKLHQRTQAKRWYDSFHRVGFQYGPSFQTLRAVRANGKDRGTAAGIQVQTECGLMPKESRYMLHPSTIDGCLQLAIASIHRGLHKEMPWGVVPLEIEELSLYFPGVDNATEGRAVAWTDKLWGRYINLNTQLLGASGKVLMDLKNIKTVIYDAAISNRALSPPAREPYAQVCWKQYVANASGSETSGFTSDEVLVNNEPIAIISGQESDAISGSLSHELGTASAPLVFGVEDADLVIKTANFDNIIINDCDGAFLAQTTKKTFENIQAILCSGKSIVWFTQGVNQGKTVSGGMAQGFLRAVRSELIASRVTLLDIDEEVSMSHAAPIILDRLGNNATKDSGCDVEFWLQADGVLHVPRVVPTEILNEYFFKANDATSTSILADNAYSGRVVENEMVFDIQNALKEPLKPLEAEIQVEFSELTADDLKTQPATPRIIVGKITGVGAELDASWVGQDVIAYSAKVFKTRVRSVTFVKANADSAALFTSTLPNLCKAIDVLQKAGNPKAGDRVLVLSSATPLVEMITKLSQIFGFEMSHPSGDLEYIRHILASASPPNVVIATSSSPLRKEVWRYMPSRSRFVLCDTPVDWPLDTRPFARGVSFLTCGVSALSESDQPTLSHILSTGAELLVENKDRLAEAPHVVDIEQLHDVAAVCADQSSLKHGVLQIRYGRSQVKARAARGQISFSSTSAYLLVGCLGGLGRSLTPWMLERGCKNFVFLSRSGADKAEAAEVVSQLQQSGASVHVFRVDASDEKAVAEVVSNVQAKMPIRGVVHAAMVLQDGMFEGLTYDKYTTAVNPKMKGAVSLHKALADTPLDFFVMTSSISAVLGNPGQANYCAGNSFLDSLAWYRRKHGLAASSIALPMVLDVGVVAENADIEISLGRKGMYGIDEREMLQAFEAGMLQGSPKSSENASLGEAQIVLGLEPAYLAAAMTSAQTTDAYWSNDARLSEIRIAVDALTASSKQEQKRGGGFVETLADKAEGEAVEAIAQHIIAQCGKILMLPPDNFDTEGSSIASYGVDSMIGVELRTWLFKELGLEIGFQTLLSPKMDFTALAKMVLVQLGTSS
ncbi:putative polyketide synthase [Glonium stellatum]|uniref:Putative polyketide synthase n=1 Tax=Glonium stellatum TaxID=574774 RepID=A0A8E2JUE7_9PEZI|nr:putative polyketide synthase [Glonium stellatum]